MQILSIDRLATWSIADAEAELALGRYSTELIKHKFDVFWEDVFEHVECRDHVEGAISEGKRMERSLEVCLREGEVDTEGFNTSEAQFLHQKITTTTAVQYSLRCP